jgi:uncharacterized protein with PIN domain
MADNMLGTLSKWLRVAGVDCEYAEGLDDDDLVAIAEAGRLVLTRDRDLASRCGPRGMYVASDELEEQLLHVLRAFPALLEGEPLSRCLVCNVPVERATSAEVAGRAPEGVLERHDEFWSCPRCGRAYWTGTHVRDMLSRLEHLRELAMRGP